MSLREQLKTLVDATRNMPESQYDLGISGVLESIDLTLSTEAEKADDVDVIPEQARSLLNVLSKSGLPEDEKHRLVEMARKIWKGWKVNPGDIEFVRKRNGDRKRIGGGASGQVYLAEMKLRDTNGEITPGVFRELAVKQFAIKPAEEKEKLAQSIREVFLQKEANHSSLVRTFGE